MSTEPSKLQLASDLLASMVGARLYGRRCEEIVGLIVDATIEEAEARIERDARMVTSNGPTGPRPQFSAPPPPRKEPHIASASEIIAEYREEIGEYRDQIRVLREMGAVAERRAATAEAELSDLRSAPPPRDGGEGGRQAERTHDTIREIRWVVGALNEEKPRVLHAINLLDNLADRLTRGLDLPPSNGKVPPAEEDQALADLQRMIATGTLVIETPPDKVPPAEHHWGGVLRDDD